MEKTRISHTLFRPPAEAGSLIIRITDGCPWNRCTFCGMYKDVKSRILSAEEIAAAMDVAGRTSPRAKRIFLADGDVMTLPFSRLQSLLAELNERFPRLARVNLYANGHSILRKRDDELKRLQSYKLNTLYMGLESGHDDILRSVKKRETGEEMIQAAQHARSAGLRMSVMILTGLGGQNNSIAHADATAAVLNAMQPRLLAALRVIPIPGTALFSGLQDGTFHPLTEFQAVKELRRMLSQLELKRTVFRANHASNIVPLEGRLPKDKPRLLAELDGLLASGLLDAVSPGPMSRSL